MARFSEYHFLMGSIKCIARHAGPASATASRTWLLIGFIVAPLLLLPACGLELNQASDRDAESPPEVVISLSELEDLLVVRTAEQTQLYIEARLTHDAWLAEAVTIREPDAMYASPIVQIREILWENCPGQEQVAVRLIALIRGGEMNDDWFRSDNALAIRHDAAVLLIFRRASAVSWAYAGSLQVGGQTREWGGPWLPVRVVCGPENEPWLEVSYGGGAGTGLALTWLKYFGLSRLGPLRTETVFEYTDDLVDANSIEWLYSGVHGQPVFAMINREPVVMLTIWRRVVLDKDRLQSHDFEDEAIDPASRATPVVASADTPCVEKIGLAVFRPDGTGRYTLDEQLSQWTTDELETWSRDLVDPWPCRCRESWR